MPKQDAPTPEALTLTHSSLTGFEPLKPETMRKLVDPKPSPNQKPGTKIE